MTEIFINTELSNAWKKRQWSTTQYKNFTVIRLIVPTDPAGCLNRATHHDEKDILPYIINRMERQAITSLKEKFDE